MTDAGIYLDYAATTPLHPEVLAAMQPFLTQQYGNPSSLHGAGRTTRKALDMARETIINALGAEDKDSILFTSGATEADNLAILGIAQGLKAKGRHLITTAIEHSAVLEPCAWLASQGWEVTLLPVDGDGYVSPTDLEAAIRPETTLVSVMHGNNEIGVIQPIAVLGAIAHQHGILFHTDAVQTLGKLPFNLSQLPIDLLSGSAHKIYGPKGSGFLYANAAAREYLAPQLLGGSQQQGLRPGTENPAGIVGLATALKRSVEQQHETVVHLRLLQEKLLSGVLAEIPDVVLNGPRDLTMRLPGNVNFSFPGVQGETLVLRLDLAGIFVSSGSACHESQLQPSHVLKALGYADDLARSSVRFSLGLHTTDTEIEAVLTHLPRILQQAGYFRSKPMAATIA